MEFIVKIAKPRKRKGTFQGIDSQRCELTHCENQPDHCALEECIDLIKDKIRTLEGQKLALSASFESRAAEVKRLCAEIQEGCNLTEFGDDNMRSTRDIFEAAVAASAESSWCKCLACTKEQFDRDLEVETDRLTATQDWLSVLRVYRFNYDFERERSQNKLTTEYFSGGSYFQRVGTYRGHGAGTMKPKLSMQNSYNVAALTRNDMKSRPLKQTPRDK